MKNNPPSKQDYYNTLSQSLEFYEGKTRESEAFFDALPPKCELFDQQQLAIRLKKYPYKKELTSDELIVAEDLIKQLEKYPLINKGELIKEIKSAFKQLKTFYLKQVGIIDDLQVFAEKEKLNKEVDIDLNIENLSPLKEVTLEILEKRGQLKDVLISNLVNKKYDK